MRVVEVVPSIHEEASGPSYSVPSLCRAVAGPEVEVSLHVLAPAPSLPDFPCRLVAHPRWRILHRLGISPSMKRALLEEAAAIDIFHNHSLWMMPNVYPARAARGGPARLVTSPRGTLARWALGRSSWRKRMMWVAFQRRAVLDSDCFHATAKAELESIRSLGLAAPVAVIPNGIDLPEAPPRRPAANARRRLLFLGRIHPKKGIDVLLRAWRAVQDRFGDWELHVVGPDRGGHLGKMKALAASIGAEHVVFPGEVRGERKQQVYREADLFVLPTHSENFGVAVAEALAAGLPAIVSKGAPWSGLEENECGWWIDKGEGPLAECLREALDLSREALGEKGARGRAWMEREFSWARVGRMMTDTYRWLLGGGSAPAWVDTHGRIRGKG